MPNLIRITEHHWFDRVVMICILANAITLGLETLPQLSPFWMSLLKGLDHFFLMLFTLEIALRFGHLRGRFFRDPWRIFDFLIVSISWLPSSGPFSVLRAIRVLRALRMVSVVPELRRVVSGLIRALPGLGAVAAILVLIFYVGSVMATNLFGQEFPEWFGTIAASAYSLFQVMTLESWSMGIVRPVMVQYPHAWLFFLPFIFVTTFTMLNLFIGVIVSAMQAETELEAQKRAEQSHDERQTIIQEIRRIHQRIDQLTAQRHWDAGASQEAAPKSRSLQRKPGESAPVL